MRLYTASRFGDYERVRAFNVAARAVGHEITHDWTITEGFGEDGHLLSSTPDSLPPAEAQMHATADLAIGVGQAERVVFFANQPNYCGALIEFGFAIACKVPIYVVAPWRPSIFWHLPDVEVLPDEATVRDRLGMTMKEAVA